MGKITKLEIQAKNKKRVNLYLDEQFACGLTVDSVIDARLRVGDELTESQLAEILATSEQQSAVMRAVDYLNRAPRTVKQIKEYLAKKGYAPTVIQQAITKLLHYHYLDDENYASNYVETHSTKKGKRKIAYELASKGVSKDIVERCVEEIAPEQSFESCKQLAEKYLSRKKRDASTRAKLYRFLISRGYEYELVSTVIREFSFEQEPTDEE